jgi:hypothetical protein
MAKISVFHSEVEENCVLPGYHAASSGNFLPIFRAKKRGKPPEDETESLSRNVGKKLTLLTT